ncbi:MAG: magnesium/cobalt transporter CorA [Gammaproteobacteria bacterium]|nr:magnesium/cobalt transporter CorA [Gammaproteobacteria bacterium]
MIRALLYDPKQQAHTEGGEELIAIWQKSTDAQIWVDFYDEDPLSESQTMQSAFGLHPLAISDAQRTRHPAKIEGFDNNTFILLKGLNAQTTTIEFGTIQIAIFVEDRFLVTRHSGVSISIDKLWTEIRDTKQVSTRGPDGIAMRLTRFVVDRYLPILLDLEQRLEIIESEMIAHPQDTLLFELVEHKSNLKKLRRIMAYHTEVFRRLRSETWPGVGVDRKHEINDVYEQLERATSLASLYHELVSDLQDGYISLASHKLNNIVKLLTIITVIFVPLSFLAGLYGMNFDNIPELHYKYAYYFLLAIMVGVAGCLLYVFKRMKWL